MKPLLFKRISLQNFGIHVATTINFSERSAITILTGANGSGKTMIVEALQLVLGFTPKTPRRRRGQAAYVSENADHALVDLTLSNPLRNGERFLKTSKPRLKELLEDDEITIRLKLNKDGTSQHYIVTNKGKGLGRPISKDELREILRNIDINTKNMLVFTEEGTITEFSKKTPLMRFRTFLEVTGLAEYHEEMSQLREEIISFKEKIKPLKERITIEQKKAQLLEQRANEYKEKVKLQSQLEDTQQLYQWVEVISLEKKEKELKEELQQRQTLLETLQVENRNVSSNLQHLKEEKDALEHDIDLLESRLMELETKLGEYTTRKRQVGESREKKKDQIRILKAEINRISKIIRERSGHQENEQLKSLSKRLQEVERQLQDIDAQIQAIETKKRNLEIQLKTLGKRGITTTRGRELVLKPTDFELRLLRAARAMREAAKTHPNLSSQLVGPVFNLIRVKQGHERWEGAVKRLCGRHLFSFIAMTREAYETAKKVYDQLDPKMKPHIEVARYDSHDAGNIYKTPLPDAPPEIHDWAINILEGDQACLWWLSKNLNSLLAENHIDPNLATDIATRHKVYIITQDEQSYYLPKGAFSGPPPPMAAPLGRKLDEITQFDEMLEEQQLQEVREQLSRSQEEHHRLRESRLNLLEEKSRLMEHIKQLSRGTDELQLELSTLELKLQNILSEIQQLEEQEKQHDQKIQALLDEKDNLTNSRKIFKKNLKDVDKKIFEQERKLEEFENQINVVQEKIISLEDEIDSVQEQLDQKLRDVLTRGYLEKPTISPEELPSLEELQREMAVLSARINQIKATKDDEEEYLKQKGKVEELRAYLGQREEHLNGLLEDLEKRLNEWKEKLLAMIEVIGNNMNELLGHKYETSLRIKKIHQLEQTELEILVRERLKVNNDSDENDEGKKHRWRDLSHLSGGEKQLVAEAFFLALHLTVNTPLHAIDEFTQRLDRDNIGLALGMVQLASEISTRNAPYQTQFLLIAPELEGYQLDSNVWMYTFAPANYQS